MTRKESRKYGMFGTRPIGGDSPADIERRNQIKAELTKPTFFTLQNEFIERLRQRNPKRHPSNNLQNEGGYCVICGRPVSFSCGCSDCKEAYGQWHEPGDKHFFDIDPQEDFALRSVREYARQSYWTAQRALAFDVEDGVVCIEVARSELEDFKQKLKSGMDEELRKRQPEVARKQRERQIQQNVENTISRLF